MSIVDSVRRIVLLGVICLLAASGIGWPVGAALAQTPDRLEIEPNNRVFWPAADKTNHLIINVFSSDARLAALPPAEQNKLLINTALVEGALQLERPESNSLSTLKVWFVNLKSMSEYGPTGDFKKLGTAQLVKTDGKVELRDIELAGVLPSPIPTVAFPFKEASASTTSTSVRFRMPEKLYVVAGQTQNFFYENLVVAKDIEQFVYTPSGSALGFAKIERRGLSFVAPEGISGEYDLAIKVAEWDGKVVAEGATKVVVVPAGMSWQPSGEPVRIFVIGHSLPSMYWPAYLANFLAGPGNPDVSFVGGIKYWYGNFPDFDNKPKLDELYHQASPGYSVATILNLYTDEAPANPNMPSKSPFIFKDGTGAPKRDIKRYFNETLKSKSPHFVLLNIGDNDTFGLNQSAADAEIEKSFLANMNTLLDELREIAPDAVFGAVMPNTYNYSDRAFLVNYGPDYPRWRMLQNRQRYIELMAEIAKARGDLVIVPSNFSVDSIDDMPYNSGTHFNNQGARHFAGSIYAWLKAQFALKGGQAKSTASAPAAPAPVVAQPPAERPGWLRRIYNRIMRTFSFS
jgi:lysophospholipase L1-like esterase